MFETLKRNYSYLLRIILFVLLGLTVIGCVRSCGARKDVQDNRVTTEQIGSQLSQIRENQREQAKRVDCVQKQIDDSREIVREVQAGINSLDNLERTEREIIGECQQILRDVRSAGETNQGKN